MSGGPPMGGPMRMGGGPMGMGGMGGGMQQQQQQQQQHPGSREGGGMGELLCETLLLVCTSTKRYGLVCKLLVAEDLVSCAS